MGAELSFAIKREKLRPVALWEERGLDIPEAVRATLRIVWEAVPSDPGSGRRPRTEAVLLV